MEDKIVESGSSTSEFKKISLWVRISALFVFFQTVFMGYSLIVRDSYPYATAIVMCGLVLIWIGYVAIEYSKERLAYKAHCFGQGYRKEPDEKKRTS